MANYTGYENCSYLTSEQEHNISLLDPDCLHIYNTILGVEESYPSFSGPPWWCHLLVQALYGIVCLIGLAGNTLVIYVVVRFSKMQTVTNLYIVNLAIADECFLIGIPFLMVTAVLGYWPFGNFFCKAYFTTTSINQITSSMFLLVMSADRYLAVCHPINAPKWRTPLIAKVVALTAWTLSALLMVPIFMYANTLEIDAKINCNIFWPESSTMSGEMIFIIYSFVLGFATPLTLILIFYILVIRRLRTVGPRRKPQSSNKDSGDKDIQQIQQQSSRAKERKKSHRKVTKLVLTVVTVYFLCWAPYWATQMALIFMPHESNHSGTVLIIFLLAGCLSYSNSAMNPILYAFLSDNFKKSFKKACSCATNKDFNNTTMNQENSIFPRKKGSSYHRHRKPSAPMTSATYAGTTCPETTTAGTSFTKSTVVHPSPPLPSHVPVSKLIPDIEESDGDGDASDSLLTVQNTYTAILVQTNEAGNLIGNRLTPNPQTNFRKPDVVTVASVNETFVQDNGVVVTAL
ncbi:Somatostatin receptor type 4 [Orchesella cincta]|uniref:Somatostatin receptor type 4 n=1 Tax=Orchesella cincta TaxID=48709 RepID=A0A1D2MZ73_ORCCI|nr:Somatostatin receptor type 4 [Orchesella cincta]